MVGRDQLWLKMINRMQRALKGRGDGLEKAARTGEDE